MQSIMYDTFMIKKLLISTLSSSRQRHPLESGSFSGKLGTKKKKTNMLTKFVRLLLSGIKPQREKSNEISLTQLSDELLCKISSYLTLYELFTIFGCLNSHFHRLVTESELLWIDREMLLTESSFYQLMPIGRKASIEKVIMKALPHDKVVSALVAFSDSLTNVGLYYSKMELFDPRESIFSNTFKNVYLYPFRSYNEAATMPISARDKSKLPILLVEVPSACCNSILQLKHLQVLNIRSMSINKQNLELILDNLSLKILAFDFHFSANILKLISTRKYASYLENLFIERLPAMEQNVPMKSIDPNVLNIQSLRFVNCRIFELGEFLSKNSNEKLVEIVCNIYQGDQRQVVPDYRFDYQQTSKLTFKSLKRFSLTGYATDTFIADILDKSPALENIGLARITGSTDNSRQFQSFKSFDPIITELDINLKGSTLLKYIFSRTSPNMDTLCLRDKNLLQGIDNCNIVSVRTFDGDISNFFAIMNRLDERKMEELCIYGDAETSLINFEDLKRFIPYLRVLKLKFIKISSIRDMLRELFASNLQKMEVLTLDSVSFTIIEPEDVNVDWNPMYNLKTLSLSLQGIVLGHYFIESILSLAPKLNNITLAVAINELSQVIGHISDNLSVLKSLALRITKTPVNKVMHNSHKFLVFPSKLQYVALHFDFWNIELTDIVTVLLAAIVRNDPDVVVFNHNSIELRNRVQDSLSFLIDTINTSIDNIEGITLEERYKLREEYSQKKAFNDFPSCLKELLRGIGYTPPAQ